MMLLYTDETNLDPSTCEFFVYGGLAIKDSNAAPLSTDIERLRISYGYRPLDPLKFNTRERPKQINREEHVGIKREVMSVAASHGVALLASIILHQIATSPDEARRNAIDTVCYHFDCLLNREHDTGLVLIDTFNDKQLAALMREKFSVELEDYPTVRFYDSNTF